MLIATPHSHLFTDEALRADILARSDAVEIRSASQAGQSGLPEIYHCELSIVAPWTEGERAMLAGLAGAGLGLVSFHSGSRYVENRLEGGAFVGVGEPMGREQMLAHARENAAIARQALGRVRLLVENNNDLGTDAYETVTDPDFLAEALDAADADLLLDVAHARISAVNRGQDERAYLGALPLGRVRQVHLSRHAVAEGRAKDAHDPLEEEDWQWVSELLYRGMPLEYVTVEYYKDGPTLLRQLERLRVLIEETR
ncbi:MAG: DUF692 family multinuclear iron-containing protein [Desulfovibrionaceae bacterium]